MTLCGGAPQNTNVFTKVKICILLPETADLDFA